MKTKITTAYLLIMTLFSTAIFAQTNWTGSASSDWNDSQNWTNGVPTATLNAIVSAPTNNNWAVISSAAACNDISIPSGSYMSMTSGATLEVHGNVNGESNFDAGDGTIIFAGNTLVSGSFAFNNIIVTGSMTANDGNTQINGNFQNSGIFSANGGVIKFFGTTAITGSNDIYFHSVEIYGSLKGSTSYMNVQGNWINNGTFIHNNGTVRFNGHGNQSIGLASETQFFNLVIDNPTLGVCLVGDVKIAGSASLVNGYVNLYTNKMTLENSSPAAVVRTNGYIISETVPASGNSFLNWNIGNRKGTYVFPFGTLDGTSYIPVSVEINAEGDGNGSLAIATYRTDNLNQPFPTGVTNLNDSNGTDHSGEIVDRFWVTAINGYQTLPVSSITFTSNVSEIGHSHNLMSEKWNGIGWIDASASQQAFATGVRANNIHDYSIFSLTDGGNRDTSNSNQQANAIASLYSGKNRISLYPNIIHNSFENIRISGLSSYQGQVSIRNSEGKEVYKTNIHNSDGNSGGISLDGKSLGAGMYFVNVNEGETSSIEKLTIVQ